MPDITENWFFEPRRDGDGAGNDDNDDESAPGLIYVPPAVLQRHGARVLDPSNAAAVPYSGESGTDGKRVKTPKSTVYRARTLLIPVYLLRNAAVTQAINSTLANVGMNIVVPDLDNRAVTGNGSDLEFLEQLPRPAVLVPAAPQQGPPVPVVVDAWVALQALRAAADAAPQDAVLKYDDVVSKITLEHLLIGSPIYGSPSTDGNGVSGSPSTDGNGVTGPSSTSSYVSASGDTRAPVAVVLHKPTRKPLEDCGPRRPVVAVLDTGILAHPWLDVQPPSAAHPTESDGFVQIDPSMQAAIYAETKVAEQQGDQPRQLIKNEWDGPDFAAPLVGELETTLGHSTFISGIVRQVAPDAQVLAIRIMHSDGVVNEYDLIEALRLLVVRIANAEAGDMTKMVDVVSLSLGYFDESSDDVHYSSGLWHVIKKLLGLGVAVVVAAGNFSTRRRFYPAAFSMLNQPGAVPVISVGALNPNFSKALFSDGGRWVTAWAKGAAVVSTYPYDINGSVSPQIETGDREALDPDDYHGGFATWSGTSFSAPLLAARLARQLLEDAADPNLALDRLGQDAATDRTMAALRSMGWP